MKSGGVGLNLTVANNVVMFDRWFNPAVEAQAIDRTYRIGQRKTVIVYKFITSNTFEEKIVEMLTSKKELSSLTVPDGIKWIHRLNEVELRDLFTIRQSTSDSNDGDD